MLPAQVVNIVAKMYVQGDGCKPVVVNGLEMTCVSLCTCN